MDLTKLIKQERFGSPALKVLLNLMVTNSWIAGSVSSLLSPFEITPAQYNVLRILRGSHPRALTCSEIGERLLDRTPDVTRLLKRLESADYVSRERSENDRRVVYVSITEKGLALLARLQSSMDEHVEKLLRHLSTEEQIALSDLLDRLRTDQRD